MTLSQPASVHLISVSRVAVTRQSEKPDHWALYHEDEMYADLAAVFARYHGRRNVIVAHSFGTCIASRLVGSDPLARARVERLVLVGTRPEIPPGAAHWIFKMPLPVLSFVRPALGAGFVARAFHKETIDTKPHIVARSREESARNPMYMVKVRCGGTDRNALAILIERPRLVWQPAHSPCSSRDVLYIFIIALFPVSSRGPWQGRLLSESAVVSVR